MRVVVAEKPSVARDLAEGSLVRATTASLSVEDGVCAYTRSDPSEAARDALLLLEWLA